MTHPRTQVVWFKRDLRVSDHAPLWEASRRGPVLCLYGYEPELYNEEVDASHIEFINQSLLDLDVRLSELGNKMTYRVGEVTQVLEALRAQLGSFTLWSHEETGNALTYRRDKRVKAWAKARGVRWVEVPQPGVTRGLQDRRGWGDTWRRQMKVRLAPTPSHLAPVPGVAPEVVRTPVDLGLPPSSKVEARLGGETQARLELKTFLSHRGRSYYVEMSSPESARRACSQLGPYLSFGNLSTKEVYQKATRQLDTLEVLKLEGAPYDWRWLRSLTSFQSRLRWRCHFIQKLESNPSLEFGSLDPRFDLLEDTHRQDLFDAWCAGRTGYPLVDACMRALHRSGWINFRMRAMLVSFATHHLGLHWRQVGIYTAKHFLDMEPGIHWSQHQMQAGTTGRGTLRIYNPVKQAQERDPAGAFIRRYVNELRPLPTPYLAEPHKTPPLTQGMLGCVIGQDYPAPIVDAKRSYREAKARLSAVRS